MTNAQLKQLYLKDVRDKAEELIAKNGTTTTLDIKIALRNDGFRANQYQVAHSMYALAAGGGILAWPWTFNGTYRTYHATQQAAEDFYDANKSLVFETSWLGDTPPVTPQAAASQPAGVPASKPAGAYVYQVNLSQQQATVTSDDDYDPVVVNQPSNGDWICFTYDGTASPIYLTGLPYQIGNDSDRFKARTAARKFYAAYANVNYNNTGANVYRD